MDVAAASALNLYSYRTALGGGGEASSRSPAVLQALASAYTSATSGADGLLQSPDALSALAGSAALTPLVSGIYQASQAGSAAAAVPGFPGLLAGRDSTALSPDATLALAAYAGRQEGLPATLTAAASGTDPNDPASVQQAIQAAQTTSLAAALNLFA